MNASQHQGTGRLPVGGIIVLIFIVFFVVAIADITAGQDRNRDQARQQAWQ